jgi:SAM-dependent methyltransferase
MPGHVDREYLSLNSLQTRIQTHRLYNETADDIELNVIDELGLAADDSLLDVGSGTASFLRRLRDRGHAGPLCALDSSPGAIAACRGVAGVHAVPGDAQHLPFGAGAFAVVTARHMLYHVPQPGLAIREARRVLRPGGRFAATVNCRSATPRMMALLHEVLTAHGISPPEPPNSLVHAGNLPGMVADTFGSAATHVRPVKGALLFPGPEPVIRYLLTTLTLSGVADDGPLREAVAHDIDARVRAQFERIAGPWRDPKGYIICSAVAG